ncbi:hypothetical protein [Mucilaginibacter sp.]
MLIHNHFFRYVIACSTKNDEPVYSNTMFVKHCHIINPLLQQAA